MQSSDKVKNRLNLGCGPYHAPKDWINIDGSWNARLSKYPIIRHLLRALHILPVQLVGNSWPSDILSHDLRKSLPFQDDSIDAIYSSHLLEHLYLEEAKRLLAECFRILRPAGVLRIVVPDLRVMVQEYIDEKAVNGVYPVEMCLSNADVLNMRLGFVSPEAPVYNAFWRFYNALTDFHTHKWMYDSKSLILWLKWAGFVEVEERKLHQSRIDGIETIEEPKRIVNVGIGVEGIKPAGTVR